MMTLPFVCSLLFALPIVAQQFTQPIAGDPSFAIEASPTVVQFLVGGQVEPVCGVVMFSPSSQLAHYFVGLPPMLAGAELLGYGLSTDRGYVLQVPSGLFGVGTKWYAQGLAVDASGVRATAVGAFVLSLIAE